MLPTLKLPTSGRTLESYIVTNLPLSQPDYSAPRQFNRIAYSAAHVVANPLVDDDPWLDQSIDWERTIAFRHYLWDLGLGVAEAMDTAQRGMGLNWNSAQELVRYSLEAARTRPDALIACGVGTDHLPTNSNTTIDDVIRAYEEQIEAVEKLGGRIILMASRALAAVAQSPDDYGRVYDRILRQTKEPVILHWLGEIFDPALKGYWGEEDHGAAMDICVDIINSHADKVDGVKISLLSAEKEILMRRRLVRGVRMYTGDEQGYSHALLGIFDAIAPVASIALTQLGAENEAGFYEILAPTVPLSRHIFKAPTRFYKTGIVFLAYLNGLQDHFMMLGGQQSARSLVHLSELFRLADHARVLSDPELAADRMKRVLAVGGVI
jgi:hypothetical protein